jgi:plastocyanin
MVQDGYHERPFASSEKGTIFADSTVVPPFFLEGRSMRKLLGVSGVRWLYSLLAIIALMLLSQAAGYAQGSRATRAQMVRPRVSRARMSRPRMSRRLVMPLFSSNPAANLGMIPMLSAYGMARPMQAGAMYPYSAGMPYGGSGSYGGSSMYPYSSGMPYGASGGYGGSQGYPSSQTAPAGSEGYTVEQQPDQQEKSWSSLLTASGVPNDNGQLGWPLGLRILAGPETDHLREQIDALFQEAANQTASGSVSSPLIQEMRAAVKSFRRFLLKDKAERFGMPLAVYQKSERFLNQLDHAAQLLQAGMQVPGGEDHLTTATPSTSSPPSPAEAKQKGTIMEVGLYDNYFQPKTITVPVGTTIEWTNHGQHRHTVTLDDRQGSSMELNMNGIYKHTFTRPAIYHYHCAVHPQEMRGTIIVK